MVSKSSEKIIVKMPYETTLASDWQKTKNLKRKSYSTIKNEKNKLFTRRYVSFRATPNELRPTHIYVPLSLFFTSCIRRNPSLSTVYLPFEESLIEPLNQKICGLGEPMGLQRRLIVPLTTAFVTSSGAMAPFVKLGAAAEKIFNTKFICDLGILSCYITS